MDQHITSQEWEKKLKKEFISDHKLKIPSGWDELAFLCSVAEFVEREANKKAVEVVKLILPLAKGYASQNCVGSNQKYIEIAEDFITPTCPVCLKPARQKENCPYFEDEDYSPQPHEKPSTSKKLADDEYKYRNYDDRTWDEQFEGAWTQDWPKEQLKAFIRSKLQAQQQTFREDLFRLNTAYQDFLNVCDGLAGDETRTGTETAIALDKVKAISNEIFSQLSRSNPTT